MLKAPNISTFIACDRPFAQSRLVLFGAPFDSTTSFRPGTRFGPNAIRQESFGIETYSPYQDMDLEDCAVCDVGDLELPFGNGARALEMISEQSRFILETGKKQLMLGGEHLITLGAFREALRIWPELCLIHFDAHTDLREHYLGEALSHASVIRRCWEGAGDGRIFSFGIRSGTRAEWRWAEQHIRLCPYDAAGFAAALQQIGARPIYLSLDLDVLDPAECPGTGTQEAGGLRFGELMSCIARLPGRQVVAADLCELNPSLDPSGRSTALAIKLCREIALSMLK